MRTMSRSICGAAVAFWLLVSCGGGTDGTGGTVNPPPPVAQSVVIGVMTKGSVIVNGVRFDDSTATIRIDGRNGNAAELSNGMFVKVLGRIGSDNVSGIADRIEVENEVRGIVQSVAATANPPSFTVAGLKVFVDGTTVFAAPLSDIGALVAGSTRVEVHGLRDAKGDLRASRVEASSTAVDELKGIVSNLTAQTFTLGTTQVSYVGATLSPSGATLANDITVEVRGSFNAATGVFTATGIDREDLEDAAFLPSNGGKLEVEGFVSGFTTHPGTFQVGSRTVQTTSTTRFEGGTAGNLGNGVKVEAEGSVDTGGTLVATKVQFKDGSGGSGSSGSSGVVELTGTASAVNTGTRTLTMFGKSVQVNDLTDLGTPLSSIVVGVTRLEVRATLDASGNVIAQRLESTSETRDIVQARVTAKNDTTFTLTLLDSINVAFGSTLQYRDANDASITRAQFFAAITPRSATSTGTLVKIRGTFGGNTLNAERAELEN